MGYTAGWIHFTTSDGSQFTVVTAYSSAAAVQCYVNDTLADYLIPTGTSVQFGITPPGRGEYIRLLAVDLESAEAKTNYFSSAWATDKGNRITVKTPTQPGWLPGEFWKVYLDDTETHNRLIWLDPNGPSGLMGGRGTDRGIARGIGAYGAGRGHWRGQQRGYEPVTLEYETAVLSPGTYEIATTTVDNADNETTQVEENMTHDTWAADPEDLLVSSFDSGTGLLTFTWTESEDL